MLLTLGSITLHALNGHVLSVGQNLERGFAEAQSWRAQYQWKGWTNSVKDCPLHGTAGGTKPSIRKQ